MEFYTSTEAKQCARNRTRIIKEINDIEQTIAEAVDNNQFSCVVQNTYMTDARETVEPSRDAKAHCIMQLSKVRVLPREGLTKNYYRVGEVLALADSSKASVENPLEFKVKEINDNGDIIDLDIVNRGEYDGEIFDAADLQYKDMNNWLDIDSDFGLVSDLRIDREENGERRITVKDYKQKTPPADIVFNTSNITDINGNIIINNITDAVISDTDGDVVLNRAVIDNIGNNGPLLLTSANFNDDGDLVLYTNEGTLVISAENIIDDGNGNITILCDAEAILADEDGNIVIDPAIIQDITPHEDVDTDWFDINKIWDINSLPDEAFGVYGDAYIRDENTIFFKTPQWLERNNIYVYEGWKMPLKYGVEGMVVYNVFGDTWVKSSHCGWSKSQHYIDLGEIGDRELNPENYHVYDIIEYKRRGVTHKIYKCCSKCFNDVVIEKDWKTMPTDDFGGNLDVFIYPEGNYRVKIKGHWMISPTEYRFDQLYLEDNWGDVHDVITYTGELEPYTTYVKLSPTTEYPKGHWTRVEKVWDMDKYMLGRLPVEAEFEWTIKSIVLDEVGDGYVYDTSVIFSDGNATALPIIVNDKIINIKLLYGGDDYTDTIPEINFVMTAPSMGKVYYQVWKNLTTNYVLQDEMDQVMSYFNKSRKYTISRVTNENTGNSFVWVVSWY